MDASEPVRPRRGLLVAVVGALVAVLAVVAVSIWTDAVEPASAGPLVCSPQVVVAFDRDDGMRRAADTLDGDRRVRAMVTETQAQALERYRSFFRNQPELASQVRAETLSASVWLRPADGVDMARLADEMRARFSDAKQVRTSDCPATPRG